MTHLLFLLLLLTPILTITITWSSTNATDDDFENLVEFNFRNSLVLPIGLQSAAYFSLAVQGEAGNGTASVDADAVLGVVDASNFPTSTYVYYEGSLDVDFVTGQSVDADKEESAGMMVSSFVRLEEIGVNDDGEEEVVNVVRFRRNRWDVQSEGTGSSEGLHTYTVKAATDLLLDGLIWEEAPADIYISWFIADTYGVVEIDGEAPTFTFPKNIESFITVENYDFEDPANCLQLVMASTSASVDREISVSAAWEGDVETISGGNSLNVAYSKIATIDGENGEIEFTLEEDVSVATAYDVDNWSFAADASSKMGGNAQHDIAKIKICPTGTEPLGTIRYDPGLSQGPLPKAPSSTTTTLVTTVTLLVLSLF